ncbi:MAG: hypothetical protein AB7I32_20170 [Gammaproteobacteria bacterium]
MLTNAMPGREREFNEWYTNVHLREVLDIPGFVAARRFELSPAQMGGRGPQRYLAIYEIEGDPAAALAALKAARRDLQMSDALDPNGISLQMFTAISERVTAGSKRPMG